MKEGVREVRRVKDEECGKEGRGRREGRKREREREVGEKNVCNSQAVSYTSTFSCVHLYMHMYST